MRHQEMPYLGAVMAASIIGFLVARTPAQSLRIDGVPVSHEIGRRSCR
jgi:hypothetical protein